MYFRSIAVLCIFSFSSNGQGVSIGGGGGLPTGPVVNALSYGCVADNSTDNNTCITSALAAISSAGGGVLYFPVGEFYTTPFIITNTGDATTRTQKPIRITGVSSGFTGMNNIGIQAVAGSILRFGSTSNPGKITTYGNGHLEVDHLTLTDTDTSSTTPFIYDTLTTMHAHDLFIRGANTGPTNNIEDAIVLGGDAVDGVYTGTSSSAFGGYGTIIENNFVDRVARFIWLRSSANGIQITNNTVWANSGWTDTNAAAITLSNSHGASTNNNHIVGNLIEMIGYVYGIYATSGSYNFFLNHFFDPGAGTLNGYKISGGSPNIIIDANNIGKPTVSEGYGDNLIFSLTNAGYIQQDYEWHFGGVISTSSTGTLQSLGRSSAPNCTTTAHIGRFWFDTNTTTTVFKVCMNVSGSVGWVTK
jgi:hypothetical protein